jgi:hypothetical protein
MVNRQGEIVAYGEVTTKPCNQRVIASSCRDSKQIPSEFKFYAVRTNSTFLEDLE